jgi:kynurenine formamidase
MEIVDLSRELFNRTAAHPHHPPIIMTVWNDHDEIKKAGDYEFSSKALSLAMSDHAGTHVDAPIHFDPRPGALSIDQMPWRTSSPVPSPSISGPCRSSTP